MKQLKLLKPTAKSYGGELLKTRKGRSTGRPLSTKDSMHLVLRSTKARGDWSFKKQGNEKKIRGIVEKFSVKYGVKVLSLGNVGNHLHFHIKLTHRAGYKPFIRAVTAAIAMAVTGTSRWTSKNQTKNGGGKRLKFWDYRPFTRVVQSFRAFLTLKDYIEVNQLEGLGVDRIDARFLIANKNSRPMLV